MEYIISRFQSGGMSHNICNAIPIILWVYSVNTDLSCYHSLDKQART